MRQQRYISSAVAAVAATTNQYFFMVVYAGLREILWVNKFTHRLTSSQASFAVVVARPDHSRTTWIAYPPDKICCSEALRISFLTDRRIASIIWMRSSIDVSCSFSRISDSIICPLSDSNACPLWVHHFCLEMHPTLLKKSIHSSPTSILGHLRTQYKCDFGVHSAFQKSPGKNLDSWT